MTSRAALVLTLAAVSAVGCGTRDRPAATPSGASSATTSDPLAATDSRAPASSSDSQLIRQAVEEHVRNNQSINLAAMDMSVDAVNVDGDRAQASVTFRLKQGDTSMAMTYSLERHGDAWLVVHSQPSNGQFVHPPMDQTHSTAPTSSPAPSGTPDVTDFLKNHPAPKNN
jgi:hypothetical protein